MDKSGIEGKRGRHRRGGAWTPPLTAIASPTQDKSPNLRLGLDSLVKVTPRNGYKISKKKLKAIESIMNWQLRAMLEEYILFPTGRIVENYTE